MAGKIPKPYVNDAVQDNNTMRYVNGGDFSMTEIGARSSGKPKNPKSDNMNLDHVGENAARK